MLSVFKELKDFVKVKKSPVEIDNAIFRLHSKVTVALLVVCSLLVTAKEYVGEPISCMFPDKVIPEKVLNNFCWINPTFTIPNKVIGRVGVDVAHPGVATADESDQVKFQKYYQWVCITLFLQALLFYVPHWLWKTWESGKMKQLSLDLSGPIISEDSKENRKKLLVQFFSNTKNSQNLYVVRYFICEALNFVNVVGQIYLIDLFLGGEFLTYGSDVLKFTDMEPSDRSDPMSLVFPKATKCTFHNYGASGSLQTFDSLCVLPLNAVNEKIYIFVWFWFVLLSSLTGLCVVYRLFLLSVIRMRIYLLHCSGATLNAASRVTREYPIGDWFVLYKLSKNINPVIFEELVNDLARTLEGKEEV